MARLSNWCAVAPLLLAAAAARANPLFAGADPHAAVFGREYWIYPTTAGAREALFGVYVSSDLRHWRTRGVALKFADVAWIDADGAARHYAWAPAIASRAGKYYLYFSVGPQNPTPSRIGVAVADQPHGPFTDSGKPLVTGGHGFEAIDPMVFIDPTSQAALLYAGGSAGAKLRVWELTDDMVNLRREIEVATPPKFTEGAFMHERDGTYYLSYSHGNWQGPDYSVHYATAPGPTGPWAYRGCILQSDATHKGPGHHSFLRNPGTGEWFIAYHRWETTAPDGPYQGGRKIAIERVRYAADRSIEPIRMTDRPPPASPIP